MDWYLRQLIIVYWHNIIIIIIIINKESSGIFLFVFEYVFCYIESRGANDSKGAINEVLILKYNNYLSLAI